MRRNKLLILLGSICLVLVMMVMACAAPAPTPTPSPAPTPTPSPSPTPAPTPTEEVYEWRLQHSWSAAESYFFDQYADIVREMSGGRIDISIFADGELVEVMEMPSALTMGTLDMGFVNPVYFRGVIPGTSVESAPFTWSNIDEFMAIYYQFGLEEEFRRLFRETYNVHLIHVVPDDYGAVLFTEEFSNLADLSGRKVSLSGAMADIMKEYGVAPVAIDAGDLYTSLAMGTLDGVSFGGAKCMSDMGFFEVANYMMLPYHHSTWVPAYWMSVEQWELLPSDLQAILREACLANGVYIRSIYAAFELEAIAQGAENWGLEVITLPEEDVQALTIASMEWLRNLKAEFPEATKSVEIVENALRTFGRVD